MEGVMEGLGRVERGDGKERGGVSLSGMKVQEGVFCVLEASLEGTTTRSVEGERWEGRRTGKEEDETNAKKGARSTRGWSRLVERNEGGRKRRKFFVGLWAKDG